MFRYSSKFKKIVALIIPLSFVLGWAVCPAICAEALEHHQSEHIKASNAKNSDSLTTTEKEDDCPFFKITALSSNERQNANVSLLTTFETGKSFYSPLPLFAVLIPEANQNSPPNPASTPLFVQFCNFRI